MNELKNEKLLKVGDVATLAQISTRSVWRLRDAGKIPMPVRVGGQVRWRFSDITQWIAEGCPAVKQ
jgi:prophage regulatory protein